MSKDTLKRLAQANPVKSPPSVPSFEYPDGDARGRRTVPLVRRIPRNKALALATLASVIVISVVLASGSSKSPVNVLAAVYAATAPREGIVESVAIIRNNPGPGHQSTEHLREWVQASAGRQRTIINLSGSQGHTNVDVVYSPSTLEIWSEGATNLLPFSHTAHNTIRRVHRTGSLRNSDVGIGLGEQWAQKFHTLYLDHQFRVTGKVSYHGKLLWKLEETQARAQARAREDQTSYYVLVDPKSFLPVYTRLIDLARPNDPTLSEIELLSLRTLPMTQANERLFDLARQHPGARKTPWSASG